MAEKTEEKQADQPVDDKPEETTEEQPKEKAEKKLKKWLEVPLTDSELVSIGDSITELEQKINEVEGEKAHVAKTLGDQIKGKRSTMSELCGKFRSKVDLREVECTQTFDYETGIVEITRDDTGEVIESREITEKEKQIPLPLDVDDEKAEEPEEQIAVSTMPKE